VIAVSQRFGGGVELRARALVSIASVTSPEFASFVWLASLLRVTKQNGKAELHCIRRRASSVAVLSSLQQDQRTTICRELLDTDVATGRNEGHVLRNLQRGLSSTEQCCKRRNIRINQDKTLAAHRLRPSQIHLSMKGRNIHPRISTIRRCHL
jgi:hypothetical protein